MKWKVQCVASLTLHLVHVTIVGDDVERATMVQIKPRKSKPGGVKSDDVDILLHLGDILTIAEEYAHAGIHDLNAYLLGQGGRPLWNLVELLNSANGA